LSEDGILILLAVGAITVLTTIVQLIGMKWVDSRNDSRKALHFSVILLCAYVIGSVSDVVLLRWVFLVFTAILIIVVKNKLLNISRGESYGIALFPLAFAALLMVEGLPRSYIVISAIVLAIADPLASIIGSRYARADWRPLEEKKSWLGSMVFFIACFILIMICQRLNWVGSNLSLGLAAIFLVSLLTTLSEMFSWRGSDNFFIPIVTALGMQAVAIHGSMTGLIVALVVCVLGFGLVRLKWLTFAGMLAVVMMASWMALMISPHALILPVSFLVIGSLLSKLNKGDKSPAKDDTKGRNAHQVFANGGMGMIMAVPYLLTHNEVYLFLFALVFTIAMSDTTSSEVGRYLKGATWNIGTLKKVVSGESGGVSMNGTLAGFLGSLIISIIACFSFEMSINQVLWLTVLGFIGMLLDSILGAFVQGKYLVHGILLEEGRKDQLVYGYHWIDNSMVNFLSVGLMVLSVYMIL